MVSYPVPSSGATGQAEIAEDTEFIVFSLISENSINRREWAREILF